MVKWDEIAFSDADALIFQDVFLQLNLKYLWGPFYDFLNPSPILNYEPNKSPKKQI